MSDGQRPKGREGLYQRGRMGTRVGKQSAVAGSLAVWSELSNARKAGPMVRDGGGLRVRRRNEKKVINSSR